MTQFDLWYTYYDSLFISSSPIFPSNFSQAQSINQNNWPNEPCQALSSCFILLESFIKCGDNWITSRCTSQELNTISDSLNSLLYFLELEKKYSSQFWNKDPRRVQASITHLYSFLQNLVRAIIPYSTMTIFECKAAYKLCVQLTNLQSLFNNILKKLSSLAEYLSSPKFTEESSLIVNFFQNFICFIHQLPKIKRNKLNHVHVLTKYVILSNPLEIYHIPTRILRKNRKKSCTIGTAKDIETNTTGQLLKGKFVENQYRKFEGYFYKVAKRSHSCENIKSESESDEKKALNKKIFSFPERISKQATYSHLKKKHTLDSFRTLTTKMDSISKKKSNTITTISSPLTKKRINTLNITTDQCATPIKKRKNNTSSLRKRETSKVRFYDEEEERFEVSSICNNRTKSDTIATYRIQSAIEVEKQQNKCKILLNQMNVEKNMKIEDGKVCMRGWAFVRAYFWERVKARKIRKAICSFQ